MADHNQLTGQFTIVSDPVEGRHVREQLEGILRAHHLSDRNLFAITLALEEAIVNAIKHGNRYNRQKTVTISYALSSETFTVCITDEGRGFNPAEVPDSTEEKNHDVPHGRGLLLLRYYMSEVIHNQKGNAITLIKRLDTVPISPPRHTTVR